MPSAHRALPLTGLVAGLGPGLATFVEATVVPGAAGETGSSGTGGTSHEVFVDDITLAEPATGLVGVAGDLSLGVGVATTADAVTLLALAAERGVAAVMVRQALLADPAVTAAAREHGIPLVAIADQASWAHVAWLLRDILDRASIEPVGAGMLGPDELFTLADACAAVIGASVTIEDTRNRVLAYSEAHDLTDPIRVSTIVGRRVPADVVSHLRARGVFRHLARSTEPIFLPAADDGTLGARIVVPVHAGGEWVGSIWGTVEQPVPEETLRPLRDIAAVVALHLLRLRAESDLGRRLVRERLRAALAGDPVAAGATLAAPPWRVVVLGPAPSTEVERRLAVWESLCRRAAWQRPTLLAVDEDVVAIVTDRPSGVGAAGPGTWTWLARLANQANTTQEWAWVAAGSPIGDAAELGLGLSSAREVARLRAAGVVVGATVTPEHAWASLVVTRAVSALPPVGPVGSGASVGSGGSGPRLGSGSSGEDAEAAVGPIGPGDALDATLVETLRAWLDHPGNLKAAATALHVHPNTVRYRMAQVRAHLGVDLNDPTVRLALALQVRALHLPR
jgi:hypothetical protein